jgi:hypothetical protein
VEEAVDEWIQLTSLVKTLTHFNIILIRRLKDLLNQKTKTKENTMIKKTQETNAKSTFSML